MEIKNNYLSVLKKDRQIIGVASLCSFDELKDLKWDLKNPCELSRFGIDHVYHKKGIGMIFLNHIINVARKKGFDGIILLVSKVNYAALKLYNKSGFENCGETFRYDSEYYCYQKAFTSNT